jgi:ABC-2 type transport system permease protein
VNAFSPLHAIWSVAVKEFIHIYRDWRILVLLLILPPVFTLIFGHAFEVTESTDVPALLENQDNSPESQDFVRQLEEESTFKWKTAKGIGSNPSLLQERVQAALIIPRGWGASLKNGDPVPLPLYLDGSDTNTASELEGKLRQSLAEFQKNSSRKRSRTCPRA